MPTIRDLLEALKERLGRMDRDILDTAKQSVEVTGLLKPLVGELLPELIKRIDEYGERLQALEKRVDEVGQRGAE